jgi:hypothetical protein
VSGGGILGEETSDEPTTPAPFDWSAVDLRPGTPFGDFFLVLIEFARENGAFSPKSAGRKPLGSDPRRSKEFYEDYKLASKRWPEVKKPKQLSKLMRDHSRKVFGGRYDDVAADAIRKRIEKLLKAIEQVKRKPPTEAEFHRFQATLRDPFFGAVSGTAAIRATLAAKRRGK